MSLLSIIFIVFDKHDILDSPGVPSSLDISYSLDIFFVVVYILDIFDTIDKFNMFNNYKYILNI